MAGNCKSQQLPREEWKREKIQPHCLSQHGDQTPGGQEATWQKGWL